MYKLWKAESIGSFAPLILTLLVAVNVKAAAPTVEGYTLSAGHESLSEWLLPPVKSPKNNQSSVARVELGKKLFFDPRLSGDSNMSCATCHNPLFGWSDGLPTARGFKSQVLGRATPTIINTAYNSLQMWDGRKRSLEDQAMGPLEAGVEMNMHLPGLFEWLKANDEYRDWFEAAYPEEPISAETASKAIAAYERTIISKDSAFERWLKGDSAAMTKQQINGFAVFLDSKKGNCMACHNAPNFTDNGFHNLGLQSFESPEPDMGRYNEKPLRMMKGAFKTPTLYDITRTAPYFHDGSAETLMEVVDHYERGGDVKTNLSPNMKALTLTNNDRADLVAFMQALTSNNVSLVLPVLPKSNGPVSTDAWKVKQQAEDGSIAVR